MDHYRIPLKSEFLMIDPYRSYGTDLFRKIIVKERSQSCCRSFYDRFINNISGETIGNFLMFLPFGLLYPLSQKEPAWRKCVIKGFIAVAVIEVLQPIFGRAFDVNDIILNSMGIVASTTFLMGVKKIIKR